MNSQARNGGATARGRCRWIQERVRIAPTTPILIIFGLPHVSSADGARYAHMKTDGKQDALSRDTTVTHVYALG